MIKGFVQGQTLKLSQTKVVADSIDYLIAKFIFKGEDWMKLDKWMHLKKGESVYAVRLQDDRTRKEDHLNLDAGEWSVWLHGNSQEDGVVTERITTNVCTFTVEQSGVLSGDALPELPAGIGEQVMARVDALETQMKKTKPLPDPGELEGGQVLMVVNGEWQAATVPSGGGDITVDAELSEMSENPVQNKVITQVVTEAGAAMEELGAAIDVMARHLAPAASINMSAFDSEGKIVETFADGTSKTTVIEFDEGGNPVKITDGDGNVTVLTW